MIIDDKAKKVNEVAGKIYFFLQNDKLDFEKRDYTEDEKTFVNMFPTEFPIYDVMKGKEFADSVECGGFIDYDGSIAEIFVDGYESNLGIWDKGMHQGKFCVSLNDFKKVCKKHEIWVNWANK